MEGIRVVFVIGSVGATLDSDESVLLHMDVPNLEPKLSGGLREVVEVRKKTASYELVAWRLRGRQTYSCTWTFFLVDKDASRQCF
jgi:hypothetical protein